MAEARIIQELNHVEFHRFFGESSTAAESADIAGNSAKLRRRFRTESRSARPAASIKLGLGFAWPGGLDDG
jgi:hypothetical protein